MKKLRKSGYYSRMLLICIVIVCSVTLTSFLLGYRLIKNQETSDFLKSYDMELGNLQTIFLEKQNQMSNSLSPLFTSSARYGALCDILRHGFNQASESSHAVISMLDEICRYDQYCRGLLLLADNGRFYQYDIKYSSLSPMSLRQNTIKFVPYEQQVLSDSEITALSLDYEKPSDGVYGIVNTIFAYDKGKQVPYGYMIVLYSTAEFSNSISKLPISPESNFIVSSDNKTYFTSNTKPFDDDSTYHTASVDNAQYDFSVSYKVPSSLIQDHTSLIILALLAVFICVAAIALYSFTLQSSRRKIRSIQEGMQLIGQNDLTYRLKRPRTRDEFSDIIESFNRMGDELEHNVKRAYVYELSQKKAELYAMQTSINPHFLYNTLEQIRYQILQKKYNDAGQMLLLLSRLYRSQTRRDLFVTVAEELVLCENLMNLYMYRFGNFEYEFNVQSAAKPSGIPKNTLQPLIENYFVHGLIAERDDNYFTIDIIQKEVEGENCLVFRVEDNGASISDQDLALLNEKLTEPVMNRKENSGFALANVNTRLKLVFGEAAMLHPSLGSEGKGFCITFTIPQRSIDELEFEQKSDKSE